MHAFSLGLLAVVVISFVGATAMASDSAPMPRDASIAVLVAFYSDSSCAQLTEKLKITQGECSSRNEKAKQACPKLIASGLPDRIDQRQVSIVVARAMGCHSMMMVGQPYDNAPFDRLGEDAFKQQGMLAKPFKYLCGLAAVSSDMLSKNEEFETLARDFLLKHPDIIHEWRRIPGTLGIGIQRTELVCAPGDAREVFASLNDGQITVGSKSAQTDFEQWGRKITWSDVEREAFSHFLELLASVGLLATR